MPPSRNACSGASSSRSAAPHGFWVSATNATRNSPLASSPPNAGSSSTKPSIVPPRTASTISAKTSSLVPSNSTSSAPAKVRASAMLVESRIAPTRRPATSAGERIGDSARTRRPSSNAAYGRE
jgi:hypothetical protein